jgi:hypothetical protein
VLSSYLDGSIKPTLTKIAASIRAPELYAIKGYVMRLLREWKAAAAALATAQHAELQLN